MGLGDNIMGSGFGREARSRGKRAALGDGTKIKWDGNSGVIFQNNPNVAKPGDEGASDLEWIPFYKGHRIYNKQDAVNKKWIWNYDFKPPRGEMFFSQGELLHADRAGTKFILIEPHVPLNKEVAPNKDWGFDKYAQVADILISRGFKVKQFAALGRKILPGVTPIDTPNFRLALACLARADLYIGPEGGLHHGAAAFNLPAVVLFGGFIPPQVTGYSYQASITGGAEACGNYTRCEHCIEVMRKITTEEVMDGVWDQLHNKPIARKTA